jgi:membrane protease YdiL (CAAX protease family)
LKGTDIRTAIQNFIFFMPFALIVGFATGFIAVSQRLPSAAEMVGSFAAIAFFIALPEEILFRGIIHNLLQVRLANRKRGTAIALTISSVIFGLAHGNNHNAPFFDIDFGPLGIWHVPWVYILLATIAGYFYGWTFIKTRSVTAAAIVHLLVDWFWGTFFSG